ncbi:MAG: hypothetical protein ABL876_02385 [Chitinophagaceae bacterium]
MTIISILGDGSVYPPINNQDLVIRLLQGRIYIGQFNKHLFISSSENYLNEPENATDLKADVLAYINSQMPGLLERRHPVHIICPQKIAAKAKWYAQPSVV